MSTTAGVFSETLIQDIRLMADKIMFDDRVKQQFIPQVEILTGIAAAQTANIMPPRAKEKDVDVVVEWLNTCEMEAVLNDPCEIACVKASTNTETYQLDWNYSVPFCSDEVDFDNNDFDIEYAIAKQKLTAEKLLAEAFAQYTVARLNTFKGVNAVTNGKGVVSGTDTYVSAAYWNATLVPYFNRVGVVNRFTSPIVLSGSNLYENYLTAKYNAGNADGKGAADMFGSLKLYFDLFNIDLVNSPDLVTYLVSTGALALANKAYNPSAIDVIGASARWKENSRFIPGFEIDWFSIRECSGDDRVLYKFKAKMKADLFLNPLGCDEHNTGVLTFLCGEAP